MGKRYYLGNFIQQTIDGERVFAPPPGVVGLLDLAPLPVQGTLASDRPVGLFVTTAAILPSDYALLGEGDCRELSTTSAMQDAFRSLTGYRPQGDTLIDLLYDLLTDGSDPAGLSAPMPLMPGVNGWCDINLGGHSRVVSAKFEWGKTCSRGRNHWVKVRQVLRGQFQQLFDDAKAGRLKDREHHRRVLDAWCEKYGVSDWREFVPGGLQKDVPGRLPHETTITDVFTRANNAGAVGSSAEGWSWSEANAGTNSGISSNQVYPASGAAMTRADSDLSSVDHYAQFGTVANDTPTAGPAVRFASAAATCYALRRINGTQVTVSKLVTGTATILATISDSTALPHSLKLSISGSTLTPTVGGVDLSTTTDTAIAGGVRTGLRAGGSGAGKLMDNFEAADFGGGGGAGILYTQLERDVRGLERGMFTRWSF